MKNKNFTFNGFTLLEFLIAFALCTFILTSVYKIYIDLLDRYYLTQNIASLQHRTQLAYLILKKNLDLAGDIIYFSKNSKKISNSLILKEIQLNDKKSGTDTLSLKRYIRFENKMQWKTISFFIRNTHRKYANNLPIFSLYRKIGNAPSEELIQGISYMSICYITLQINQKLNCLNSINSLNPRHIKGVYIKLLLDAVTPIGHLSKHSKKSLSVIAYYLRGKLK